MTNVIAPAPAPAPRPLEISRSATSLVLPWVPSTNGYWRSHAIVVRPTRQNGYQKFKVVTMLSERARAFRIDVIEAVRRSLGGRPPQPYTGDVRIDVELRAPDCRTRDLDNHAGKALFDALTHAGVWKDDSQVREMTARFGRNIHGGQVIVLIAALDPLPEQQSIDLDTEPKEF